VRRAPWRRSRCNLKKFPLTHLAANLQHAPVHLEVISKSHILQQYLMCYHVTERTRKDTSGRFCRKTSRPAHRGPKVVNFYPLPWFPLEYEHGGQPVPTTSAGEVEDTFYEPYRTPPTTPERVYTLWSAAPRRLNRCGKPHLAEVICNQNKSVTSVERRRSARIAVM
jgi:hypothetical protein